MIRFQIDESYDFRGGNFYCDFYANSPDQVMKAIKDAWVGSGIKDHEGELFLSAYLKDDDGNDIELFFRHCAVVRDRVRFNFSVLNDDFDPWFSFGMFCVDSTDDVIKILKNLFDYNSPDRVIGSYLYKVNKKYNFFIDEIKANFDAIVLANILNFGRQENKLIELSRWIFSKKGLQYFEQLEHSIDMKFPEIANLSKSSSVDELNAFIERNLKELGAKIYLPSKS